MYEEQTNYKNVKKSEGHPSIRSIKTSDTIFTTCQSIIHSFLKEECTDLIYKFDSSIQVIS